jgi:hypothetical protein
MNPGDSTMEELARAKDDIYKNSPTNGAISQEDGAHLPLRLRGGDELEAAGCFCLGATTACICCGCTVVR